MFRILAFCVCLLPLSLSAAEPLELVKNSNRILLLGDSITASGGYIAHFDAWLVAQKWDRVLPAKNQTPTVINCGLQSETVSGLSEDGHAGGKFPRPDLFERLDRVLALAKPDLVFACYGMNCGIYLPFDGERFAKYQEGWKKLKTKVEAAGGKLIIITPPFYDDLRSSKQGTSLYEKPRVRSRHTECGDYTFVTDHWRWPYSSWSTRSLNQWSPTRSSSSSAKNQSLVDPPQRKSAAVSLKTV
jgi:hypothetical protein